MKNPVVLGMTYNFLLRDPTFFIDVQGLDACDETDGGGRGEHIVTPSTLSRFGVLTCHRIGEIQSESLGNEEQ